MISDDKNQNQGFFSDDDSALSDSDSQSMTAGGAGGRRSGQQGFASMPKDRQREIASKGGKAAHEQGTAHEWDSEEARQAGRKGGLSRAGQQEDLEEAA